MCCAIAAEGIADSLRLPGSLLGALHTAAGPLLSQFASPEHAAAGLAALARNVESGAVPPPGSLQEHLLAVLGQQVACCVPDKREFTDQCGGGEQV